MSNLKGHDETPEVDLRGKRILSIYYRHKPGGLCKRLYLMFHALVAAGGEVHYIAVEPYPLSHPRIIPHILWTPFKKKEGSLFWGYFLCFAPFYAFYVGRKEAVHLVSVFGAVYGVLAIFLKVLQHLPLLIFIRADGQEVARVLHHSPLRLFMEGLFLKAAFVLCDQVVAVSDTLKKTIAHRYALSPNKISVLNNHISDNVSCAQFRKEARQKIGLDEKTFVVLTVAVLDTRKNIALLIKAAHLLNQPALFLIVGEGPERHNLEALSQSLAGKVQFRFVGWQEDVQHFLSASDLFVLPSKHEGCSNALLEALSSGLSCLASDINENREVLQSELLFDVNNPAQLSDKIDRIISDSEYFKKVKLLSEDARKQLIFNWDRRIVVYHQRLLSL